MTHGTAPFDATGREATMVWASTAIPGRAVLALLPSLVLALPADEKAAVKDVGPRVAR